MRSILAVMALVLACDANRSAAPATSDGDLQSRERLARGEVDFAQALAVHPEAEVRVLLSFTGPRDVAEVVDEARRHALTITGFRHAFGRSSGGYTLSPGERVEDAMVAYRRDSELFTQMRPEKMRRMASEAPERGLKDACEREAGEASARLAALEASGVIVVGVEVLGTAAAVEAARRATPFVRGVEIQTGSRHNAAVPFQPFVR